MLTPYNRVNFGQGSGEAFVLGTDNTALRILQQGRAAEQRAAAQAAALRQKADAERARQAISNSELNVSTGEEYQPLIYGELAPQTRDKIMALYQRKDLDPATASYLANKEKDQFYLESERGKAITAQRLKRQDALLKDPTRDGQYSVGQLLRMQRDENDKLIRPSQFYPETWNKIDEDPLSYQIDPIIKNYLQGQQADTLANAKAGKQGAMSRSGSLSTNLFIPVANPDGTVGLKMGANNLPEIDYSPTQHEQAMTGRPFAMAVKRGLLEYEKQRAQNPSLPERGEYDIAKELLRPYAYQRQQVQERFTAPPRPLASLKPKATDVVVTPAVGFQASDFTPTPAPGRMAQMARAMGITPAKETNYYATAGESFGSAARPYVPVTIDNKGIEVVGQNGEVTRRIPTGANGKVQLDLTSRDYVLYINGKRLGRREAYNTPQEAYEDLLRTIDGLTPEQARKAELRAEYRGTIADKSKTANDGAGGRPVPIGMKLTDAITPVYDNSVIETRLSVIVPADQYTDGQLQRVTAGKWKPQQATPQQQQVMEAILRQGGRVVNPYGTQQGSRRIGPTSPSASKAKPGPKLIGTNDALGFGATPKKKIPGWEGTSQQPAAPQSNGARFRANNNPNTGGAY